MLEYSDIVSIIYVVLYGSMFVVSSMYIAYKIKYGPIKWLPNVFDIDIGSIYSSPTDKNKGKEGEIDDLNNKKDENGGNGDELEMVISSNEAKELEIKEYIGDNGDNGGNTRYEEERGIQSKLDTVSSDNKAAIEISPKSKINTAQIIEEQEIADLDYKKEEKEEEEENASNQETAAFLDENGGNGDDLEIVIRLNEEKQSEIKEKKDKGDIVLDGGEIERAIKSEIDTASSDNKTATETSPKSKPNTASSQSPAASKQKGGFFKMWFKSIWRMKKVYYAVIPHVMDQASDIGVIIEYYMEYSRYKIEKEETTLNPMWLFIFSVFIVLFQRIASSITIYMMTSSVKAAAYQCFDVLIIKAIAINYMLGLETPSNPQRYIELLECIFESGPQLLLSFGYILKQIGDDKDVAVIVVISTIFSIWSITSKVISDDAVLFNEEHDKWKELGVGSGRINIEYIVRAVFWRFFEISSRFTLLVSVWINIGGISLIIILFIDFLVLLLICYMEKTPDCMASMIFISFSGKSNEGYMRLFWYYRLLSMYLLLILVTIVAVEEFDAVLIPKYDERSGITIHSSLGLAVLIWSWCAGFIWPYIFGGMFYKEIIDSKNMNAATRDVISLIKGRQWAEAKQLVLFGVLIKKDYIDSNGDTILHVLCRDKGFKDPFFFEQCIKMNPEWVNTKNEDGKTPFDLLGEDSARDYAMKFVVCNDNVNEKNDYGKRALLEAANKGHVETVRYVIENGININEKGDHGRTALHLAAIGGAVEVIRCLIENGININEKDNEGWTALHLAARDGRVEVTRCLIENGININEKNNYGETALHLAASYGRVEVARYLIENRININEKNNNGQTALHWAARRGHVEVTRCLIENGININEKDNDGQTAFDLAKGKVKENKEIMNLLKL